MRVFYNNSTRSIRALTIGTWNKFKTKLTIEPYDFNNIITIDDEWSLKASKSNYGEYINAEVLHTCFMNLSRDYPKLLWKAGTKVGKRRVSCYYCKAKSSKEVREKIRFLLNETEQ